MKAKVILMTLAVIASIGIVSTQTTKTTPTKSESKKSCYVDANKNNVCDNYENKTCTKGNGKGQHLGCGNGTCGGNGQSQHLGKGNGKGANFVDANKNGVCDNRETK